MLVVLFPLCITDLATMADNEDDLVDYDEEEVRLSTFARFPDVGRDIFTGHGLVIPCTILTGGACVVAPQSLSVDKAQGPFLVSRLLLASLQSSLNLLSAD